MESILKWLLLSWDGGWPKSMFRLTLWDAWPLWDGTMEMGCFCSLRAGSSQAVWGCSQSHGTSWLGLIVISLVVPGSEGFFLLMCCAQWCCSGVCVHRLVEGSVSAQWWGEEGPRSQYQGRGHWAGPAWLQCVLSSSPFPSLTESTKKIRGKWDWLPCSDKPAFAFNESAFCLICVFLGGNDEF